MTLLQALLIALLGYLGSIYEAFLSGTIGGWNVIGRPIVVGTLTGLILRDVKNGVLVGATIQALYVGLIAPGMSMPGDVNFASYIGMPLVLVSNVSPKCTMGISVPLSLLGVTAVCSVATFSAAFVRLQDRWIEEDKLKQATRILIYPNILQFVIHFIPILLACCFGAGCVPKMIALIPDQLGVVSQMLGGILPTVGFVLLIKFTLKEDIELLYALVGFIMMVVLKMLIVVITMLTTFITYLNHLRCVKQSQER